jgi:hypothetical protein
MALIRELRDEACESRPEILLCVTQRPFCLIVTGLAARLMGYRRTWRSRAVQLISHQSHLLAQRVRWVYSIV